MATDIHPVFLRPDNPEISIWRYMDFTKFVSMLENNGLYLSRADFLGDPFEGSNSRGNEKLRPLVYKGSKIPPFSGDHLRGARAWTFINCWHMNAYESAAMWNLYAKTNEAVAIRSTFKNLDDALDKKCFLGIVQYIDYENDWLPEGNMLYPYVHKCLSFAHEQEIRVVVNWLPSKNGMVDWTEPPPVEGIWKAVSLQRLIDSVYVAPSSPEWFKHLVEQIVVRYALGKPVFQSALDREPFF